MKLNREKYKTTGLAVILFLGVLKNYYINPNIGIDLGIAFAQDGEKTFKGDASVALVLRF